jgi:hypothetical protein
MKIRNELEFFATYPTNQKMRVGSDALWFLFFLAAPVLAVIGTIFCLASGFGVEGLLCLVATGLNPLIISLNNGNARNILNENSNQTTPKGALWETHRNLPPAVAKIAGPLAVEQIQEMDDSDVEGLRSDLDKLTYAYWRNQKALTSPHLQEMRRNLQQARAALHEQTDALLNPKDALDELEA